MPNNLKPIIQIVGPFATNYSLSKVNRELAIALDKYAGKYKTKIWANENIADKMPDKKDFEKHSELSTIFSEEQGNPRFEIYNNFPKSFPRSYELDNLKAEIKTAYIAWEESAFPKNLAQEINNHLHGLMVTSEHVKRIMRNSGVSIPIVNVGEGLNQSLVNPAPYKLKTKKNFKFLHISSGIPRKGLDLLIKAYVEEFNNREDVCLLIKSYHNEENQIPSLIAEYQKPGNAEIEVIYDLDLTDAQIAYLYEQSDAVVIPSRAEGFGLPIAEAMLKKKPLITTGYGGQMDFVSEDNAFLLDFDIVKADSQLNIPGSTWAEPSIEDLRTKLRYLYENAQSVEVTEKLEKAYSNASHLTWENTVNKVVEFLEYLEEIQGLKNDKVAVITTYNSVCGVAEYSKDLYENIEGSFREVRYYANSDAERVFEDPSNLERTWEYSERDFKKTITSIEEFNPNIVLIQYNAPFYTLEALSSFISATRKAGRRYILTIHSLPDSDYRKYLDVLGQIEAINVHSAKDMDKLEKAGYNNVVKFNHGVKEFPDQSKQRLRKKLSIPSEPIVASHGLIHEHKGLLETLEAISLLVKDYPTLKFLSINAVNKDNATSSATFTKMQEYIVANKLEDNVLLVPEFLDKAEIVSLLHLADVLVLPYDDLNEGASGAVRYCLSANRPVIITNSSIFEELDNVGYRIANNDPENIASGLRKLLSDKDQYSSQLDKAKKFIRKYSWENQSREYLLLLAK